MAWTAGTTCAFNYSAEAAEKYTPRPRSTEPSTISSPGSRRWITNAASPVVGSFPSAARNVPARRDRGGYPGFHTTPLSIRRCRPPMTRRSPYKHPRSTIRPTGHIRGRNPHLRARESTISSGRSRASSRRPSPLPKPDPAAFRSARNASKRHAAAAGRTRTDRREPRDGARQPPQSCSSTPTIHAGSSASSTPTSAWITLRIWEEARPGTRTQGRRVDASLSGRPLGGDGREFESLPIAEPQVADRCTRAHACASKASPASVDAT